MPSRIWQEVKIVTYKDKNGQVHSIMISRNTGYLNFWYNDIHYFHDFTNGYPIICGNTYEAHYHLSDDGAHSIDVNDIVQAIEDKKEPKQTIVIRRRKRG